MIPPVRSKWSLTAPTLRDLIVLCAQMRPDEIEQWEALMDPDCFRADGSFDFEKAAVLLYSLPGLKFSLFAGDKLLVSGGYFDQGNGVYKSWMVGTMDHWRTHWRSITEATKFVMDCMLQDGIRRLETYALASRELTGHWYVRGLGMEHEGILRGYGYQGQNVAVYSRVSGITPRLLEPIDSEVA
jgi:hypothetical protein